MIIRKANENDIIEISKLYVSNWKKTYKGILPQKYLDGLNIDYGIEKWGKYINEEEQKVFVAYENDEFLGFTACKVDDEEKDWWYLDSLHVSEGSRGKGIGTKLINTVGKYAFDNKYKCMSICIVKGNDNAKELYEKLGAKSYKCFIDDFGGIKSNSEKLIWTDLNIFNK
ncbi:MAG: GNAT family N-acetyltransferase [Clostridium sp.]|nr:GNAT family N-acetyltransferase [Clostridium sp.]